MVYSILHPEIMWDQIATIYRSCGVLAQTPEVNGYIRICTQVAPEYNEFCFEDDGRTEFVTGYEQAVDIDGTPIEGQPILLDVFAVEKPVVIEPVVEPPV